MTNPELISKQTVLREIKNALNDFNFDDLSPETIKLYNRIVERVSKIGTPISYKSDEVAKQCKYYNDGACMGQKCAPACSPNSPYCPMRKYNNG